MNDAVLAFLRASVSAADVAGRSVLEVGALDVNGSARHVIEPHGPASYLGVDIRAGRGVDQVMSVSFLTDVLGDAAFDLVVSTEMLEHVQDWRWAISQLKRVTAPGGRVILTTRSPGFHYHGYPHDFWRFTEADMRAVFADMTDVEVSSDASSPGVFVSAVRPSDWSEIDLWGIEVATCPDPSPGPLVDHVRLVIRRRLSRWRR